MSQEAELNLLSCLCSEPELIKELDISSDDFVSLENKQMFLGFEFLRDSNKLTLDNLMDFFEKQGKYAFFVELLSDISNPKHIQSYAKVIKRDSNSAQLASIARDIQEICQNYGSFDEKLEKSLDLISALTYESDTELPGIDEVIGSAITELEVRYGSDGLTGLSTGFEVLDTETNGLQKGELYILAARPAMGKSTMLINICSHAAKNDKHVYFASLEMPKERVIDKIASDFGKVPYQNIKTGDMQDCEFATMAHGLGLLSNKNFIIDDTPAQDITKLRIKLKKMAARKPLDLIAIDYLQLLKDNKTKNRFDEISEISRQLKELSKTLNCPIIALSQLNRGVENRQDKRPSTADLRESGQIEQDADLIAFLYRDEVYYQEWEGNKGVAELIISKARFGTLGTHLLGTELQYSRFTNATDGIKAGYRRYEKPSNQGGFNG